MNISYEGIGAKYVTFPASATVAEGKAVTLGQDGMAASCAAADRFFGVALSPRAGAAAIQVKGFATVSCEDAAVKPGWVTLVADGNGGVRKVAGSESGKEYLVAEVDAAAETAVILL